MFQYAAARALALRKGVPLKLDLSEFTSYNLHQGFELARVFNCSVDLAQAEDIRKMLGWQASTRVHKLLSKFNLEVLKSRKLIIEPSFNYWNGINELLNDCYLKGYWQSEKYFIDAAMTIRNDFIFRQPFNKKNAELATLISEVNAVSLHIRRGDYVKNGVTLAKHGICSPEYYRAAIARIADEVDAPFFFIFSDDIEWVRTNINFKHPSKLIDHNSDMESFNDMHLMSICKHHIISNSSFSWWGAWLAQSPSQMVIAPDPWFDDLTIDTNDLLPDEWIKIRKHGRVTSDFI